VIVFAPCRWGDLRGDEMVQTKDDILRMVNLKRGVRRVITFTKNENMD
jgi:hypothetical protein